MGSTLICFLVSEQTAGLLCWLRPVLLRTGVGGLGGFASATFPVPVVGKGGTWDFRVQYKESAENLRTACQRKEHNFSDIPFLSMKDIYEGIIIFTRLSAAHCVSAFLHTRHLLCLLFFFFKSDFCLETSAILFSLVETVHAILKDQLKYNFQKISAS